MYANYIVPDNCNHVRNHHFSQEVSLNCLLRLQIIYDFAQDLKKNFVISQ